MRYKVNITIRLIFLNQEVARSLDANPVQFYYVVVVKSPVEITKTEIRKTASEKNHVTIVPEIIGPNDCLFI